MSKATPGKGPTTSGGKGGTKAPDKAKAGKGGYFVGPGTTILANGKTFNEGDPITQADLSHEDNDGAKDLQRKLDSGKIVGEAPDLEAGSGEKTIGGAGPSAAQITAAETGNDAGAAAVVAAAQTGDAEAFTAAAEAGSTPPTDDAE